MFNYQNRGISTLVTIVIIAVLVVVVGGGILAYQRYYIPQQTLKNQQAKNQNNQNDSGTTTCVDSDGGTNYYVAGQAKIVNNSPNQQFLDDECRGNTLIEAGCSNGRITSTTYVCPNSCLDGACVNSKLSINVTSPNGGEVWKVGETHNITWTSSLPQNSRVLIYLSKAGSNYDYSIATSISATLGTYSWTIPATVGGGNTSSISIIGNQWKVLIEYPTSSGFDTSDNYFSIAASTFDQTAGWQTYTNSNYNFQIKYPNNWFAEMNSLNNTPDLVFCPPNLTYHSSGSTGCMNQPSGYQSGMIYLFAYDNNTKPNNINYQYLGFNSGKYYYLFNDNGSKDIFTQIISTFKFTK